MKKEKVVTRFPPSPTGFLHLGRIRTALFNYLFAKQNGGRFILRFEDTDKVRSKKIFEESIIESLKWLGLEWDNEIIERQTERTELYKKYLKKLIEENKAYISKEKIKEGEKAGQENDVVRFKNPNQKITFTDLIRGEITFDTEELEDFIIARNINEPLYHLAVVIDDYEMGVTHIIRGEDGISNTPRQILIQQAIGAPLPLYAHLPLVLAPDRSRLSGRKGAVSVMEYMKRGYLPEAIINYMALLGWNPGTDQEIFSLDELVEQFDISKIQKAGAIFNEEKLNWFNKKYVEKLPEEEFLNYAKKFLLDSEFSFVKSQPNYPKELLKWKDENLTNTKSYLKSVIDLLSPLKDFRKESIKSAIWGLAEEKGKGNVLWPMRVALSGKEKSPDPFISSEILGKEETIRRLTFAHELL